ncbi:5142_t:CDS:2, partial [Racocetra fulgida]
VKIHSKYVAETGKHISIETIRNTLRRCGYKARVKPRKPAINEKARLERLHKLEPDYVDQTKKFGGGGIMVWSCITSRGVDNKGYCIILAKDLVGTLLEHDLDLKDRLKELEQESATKKEKLNKLWKMVEEEWKKIDINFIASLYDSMPRRMAAVIAND